MRWMIFFICALSLFALDHKATLDNEKVENVDEMSLAYYLDIEEFFIKLLRSKEITNQDITMEKREDILIIKDKVPQGQGVVFLKKEGKNILQVPHCFYDLYTCDIGWKLFNEHNFFAVQFATAHRYSGPYSDLAHTQYSYFTALATAFAKVEEDGTLMQIHGFSQKKRKGEIGEKTDIIVSNGTKRVTFKSEELNRCFRSNGFQSKLYPVEINELGGTTNSSNRAMRNLGHQGFIHIELSKKIRKNLLKSSHTREVFRSCLK